MVWRGLFTAAVMALTAGAASAQDGPLRTAVDGTFAPHAMPTMSGGVEGFNIDLANEIARRLGREIEITPAQWSGLIPGLQAGTYDFLMAPVTVTEERAETLLFTEGYLNTDYQFVVKKGAPEYTSLEDFKGKTIAVNKGSAYDMWLREHAEEVGYTVENYGTNTDAIQAVISGRADANVGGNTVSAWAVKQNPQLELSYLHTTGLVVSSPFRKDDTEMRNKVEEVIECMKMDGFIAGLSEKWLGVTPAEGSPAVTVQPGYGPPDLPGYDPTEHEPNCES